jgi:hypothetical protein
MLMTRKILKRKLRRFEGSQTLEFKNRWICKDDSIKWLVWSAIAEPTGLMYAVARDITELVKLEKAKEND